MNKEELIRVISISASTLRLINRCVHRTDREFSIVGRLFLRYGSYHFSEQKYSATRYLSKSMGYFSRMRATPLSFNM